jgi:hypothetical protein
MDRNLQKRPRDRHLADAVARSHAAGDCCRDAEDPACGCAGLEEGEAVDHCLGALVGLVEMVEKLL